jgi:hypothetical protein
MSIKILDIHGISWIPIGLYNKNIQEICTNGYNREIPVDTMETRRY